MNRKKSKWMVWGGMTVVVLVAAGGFWYTHSKVPTRSGEIAIKGLTAPVSVRYDERGVPHIKAANQLDMYRALGYVQAQDRLFQMEILRRLSQGELSEVLGTKTLDIDKFFRTLGIKKTAEKMAATLQVDNPKEWAILNAYLDGVNDYVATRPSPFEFDLLHIKKHRYTVVDSLSIAGYIAYSFNPAFTVTPPLSFISDKLGANYAEPFTNHWHPNGVTGVESSTVSTVPPAAHDVAVLDAHSLLSAASSLSTTMAQVNWSSLATWNTAQQKIQSVAQLPTLVGSNAWSVSGRLTQSGKPILAGDPHIDYASPSVWYEADLKAPGFDLYGYFLPIVPAAILGANEQFAWSLTIFMNTDTNFIALQSNPKNPHEIKWQNAWQPLKKEQETILVKGHAPVELTRWVSPDGPIVNDIMPGQKPSTPIALRWAFQHEKDPLISGFFDLNTANTLEKVQQAASKIAAPGLNLVWANAAGDIGWWAVAKLPIYPPNVNPLLILDASRGQDQILGYRPFSQNPHEINPSRGFVVSANQQPTSSMPIVGTYSPAFRANEIFDRLNKAGAKFTQQEMQAIQLDNKSAYGPTFVAALYPDLLKVVKAKSPEQVKLVERLHQWDGVSSASSVSAVLFNQLMYELAHELIESKIGHDLFKGLSKSFPMEKAMLRIAKDSHSPWWGDGVHPQEEARQIKISKAWSATLLHLEKILGKNPDNWHWARAQSLTQNHPLGVVKPLNWLLNVGPFSANGGVEAPNAVGFPISSAPWSVKSGPSTRRVIDFGYPNQAVGILPTGESGVPFDRHYSDQAASYFAGKYQPQWMSEADIKAHTRSTLELLPAR